MVDNIVDLVATSVDRDMTLKELRLVREAVFRTDVESLDMVLRSGVRADVSRLLRQRFEDLYDTNGGDGESRNNKIQFLDGLEKALVGLPVVKVELAVHPTEELLEWLLEYFSQTFSRRVILDVEVDTAVVGGLRVSYEGNYHDWTLSKSFSEVLDNKLGEAIRRVMQ